MLRPFLAGVTVCGLAVAGSTACGSETRTEFTGGTDSAPFDPAADGGLTVVDANKPDVDQYANDPPPPWCGAAGQPVPPVPGGSLACPDDKNKPGCACKTAGSTAACWTGLRKHRNIGVCKDGITTCGLVNEVQLGWGECKGEVLPTSGATKGREACGCFSAGQWKLANTSPCFVDAGNGSTYAISTVVDSKGQAACPTISGQPPFAAPSQAWTKDTLKVDCAGKFTLCFALKAGSFDNPTAQDCVLSKTCVTADYTTENAEQGFPDLPGWSSNDSVCAKKFVASGGYGEMTVLGQSVRCDKIDDGTGQALVFNRVRYCEAACSSNPALPQCAQCQQGGSGQF